MTLKHTRVVLLCLSCLLSAGCTDRIFNDELIFMKAGSRSSPIADAAIRPAGAVGHAADGDAHGKTIASLTPLSRA